MLKRKEAYTVTQVNKYIADMFRQDFVMHSLRISGEVSNCKYHSSGHIYFTLKDERAAISAVMFAGARKSGLTFPMKDGDRVVVTGSIEVYERDGRYQIYARAIEQEGEGELYVRFEALKRELEEMGMFDAQYKQPIPGYARRVGIVTSPTGAAIRDIQNVAGKRNPFVQLILCPAQVQGEGAAETIVAGIQMLERIGVDVMIVGRGGGSIEDLWAFNEEIVARAIFDCSVPVISAVGHEVDYTIADFVADRRAATPSQAAEFAVYDYREAKQRVSVYRERLYKNIGHRADIARAKLEHKAKLLSYMSPENKLNEKRRQLLSFEEKLENIMGKRFEAVRHRLALFTARLEGASPLKKLSGGYSYVEDAKGLPVKSVTQVGKGDDLRIHVTDGTVLAKVHDLNKKELLYNGTENEA